MSVIDKIMDKIKDGLRNDIEELMKADDANSLPEKPQELTDNKNAVAEKVILNDPYFENATQHFVHKSKMSRVSNRTLKDVSFRDWLVSSIIQVRIDTMLRFSRPEHQRFEMGFQITKRDHREEFTQEDHDRCRELEDFIYHCGRTEKIAQGREMLLGEFLKLTLRDALTFGHIAVEKVLTRKGALHHFRPVPGESTYLINQATPREIIEREVEASRQHYLARLKRLNNDPSTQTISPVERKLEYYKYVQMSYDNKVLAAFGDEDMIWKLFNPQNSPDSIGYCYLPGTAYVTMGDNSLKLLEEVQEGELVVTDDNNLKKVYDTKTLFVDEDIYSIAGYGIMPHVVTGEHPLLIVPKGEAASFKDGWREFVTPKWIAASSISLGDFLTIPKRKLSETLLEIVTTKYGMIINDRVYSTDRACNMPLQNSLPTTIKIDQDFGWMLGLYLGDGYCTNDTVSIALGIEEEYIVERLVKIYSSLGLKTSIYKYGAYQTINVNSRVFVKMIKDLCPGTSRTKCINPILYDVPNDAKLGIILGHIESDGYHAKKGNITAGTASIQLANNMVMFMNSLGYLAKIQSKQVNNDGSGYITDLKETYSIFYPTVFDKLGVTTIKNKPVKSVKNKCYFEDSKNFYLSISKIEKSHYEGPVYNLEVEDDHSFIVNQAATHNCYGPLELAIIQITNHLNVENYNANFFTHGFAARGLIHLKGTVTQSQLAAFRRQFYNAISGVQHAWRTPIIAGLDDVQWIQMSGSAREMEYINFNHHLMRTICTQFQIDPVELGLDFLTSPSGRSASQQANNEYKINYSRERGLYPVLMFYEDFINNDILPALDKELASKYMFKFVGYTDETPQTNIALKQAEMTVFSSMNDLLRDAKKEPIDHPVGDLPMNQAFWAVVNQMMTKGEQRATFFNDKEALGKPELAYLPGDPSFLAWSQFLMTKNQMKKQQEQQEQQMQQEGQQQELEAKHAEGEHNREQEKHDAEMNDLKSRQAHAAVTGNSMHDIAKQVGLGSKPLEGAGGPVANPVNTLGKDA